MRATARHPAAVANTAQQTMRSQGVRSLEQPNTMNFKKS
jgi:hypothetical protein